MTADFLAQLKSIALKSATDDVFVIGKGPSIDHLDLANLKGTIVNLNDSEWILPGQLAIFYESWVLESIKQAGYKSGLYLTCEKMPDAVPHALMSSLPLSQENKELLLFRFESSEWVIEEILFATALKVAKQIAAYRGKKQDVYMLGFDFTKGPEQASERTPSFQGSVDQSYRQLKISMQEQYFTQFIEYLKEGVITLNHVGEKQYSSITPEQFNQKFSKKSSVAVSATVKPAVREDVKPGKVLVVAEFTNNHLGDLDRLAKMVSLAGEAGADLIKVQKRDVDTFYSKEKLNSYYKSPFGTTLGDYRRQVELTKEGFEFLDKECKRHGLKWFASVLDFPSFKFLQQFDCGLLKIPSTISNHKHFHRDISREFNGSIVISTGYTSREYEQYILNLFGSTREIYLLQCTSAYPTPAEHCQVAVVRHYSKLSIAHPNVIPGFSSHDAGSLGCMLAVAAGAKMIEKHVKLGSTDWVHFDEVALDLESDDFAKFVRDIRLAELMCGEEEKTVQDSENHKYEVNSK